MYGTTGLQINQIWQMSEQNQILIEHGPNKILYTV